MSQSHPELIFVAGPQVGQRVQLNKPVAVLGRGGEADILLSEEYVSRKQLRYELLKAGPTVENLSSRGTWINGKRFKGGKRVLVETGDLIGVGNHTQILFVGAGDDPDQTLTAYKQAGANVDAFGRPSAPKPAPAPPAEVEQPKPKKAETQAKAEEKRPSQMTAGERAQAQRKARQKKIVIGLAAWWGTMGLLVIVLAVFAGGGQSTPIGDQPILTKREISRFLAAQPSRPTPNRVRRDEWLAKAVKLYNDYHLDDPWKLSETVEAFKQALAYSGRISFEDPEHQRLYRRALERLVQEIADRYHNACVLEKNKEWTRAKQAFDNILQILGDKNHKNPVFRNGQAHLSRVKHFERQEQSKKRRGWKF